MSATALAAALHNASFLVREGLPSMVGRTATPDEALDFCTQLRRRGIAALLLQGAPADLLRDLSWSGRAYLHVLPSIPEAARATGLQTPFFDAVAAGDVACAGDMARASRTTWNPGEELEDDFLYVSVLMALVVDHPEAMRAAALARYEALTAEDEDEDLRLRACLALVKRDGEAFDEALAGLMAERKARYRTLAAKEAIPEEEAATEGKVSIEGLALVRIAESRGLAPKSDYPMVPSLARRIPWRADAPDAWMTAGR